MDPALAAALDEMEDGARKRLERNKEKLQQLYEQEEKHPLIGHIEVEMVADSMTDEDKDRPRVMQSIFQIKEEAHLAQVMGQQR